MNSDNFNRGDILEATERRITEGYHYIIYYDSERWGENFIGGMITRSNINDNAPMLPSHFKLNDDNGDKFKIVYDNSHLVRAKLKKLDNWGPYKKVGELTSEGITFVEQTIGNLTAMKFSRYYAIIMNK